MSSPLIDGARRLEQGFENFTSKIPTPGHKAPASNNEADPDAVRAANKTFADKAAKDKAAAPVNVDHKSAVQKMQPEHVHKLVQDAHDGKFGPEAQKTAQSAMQAPAGTASAQDQDQSAQPQKPNYASMFSGGGASSDEPDDQPVSAGQMFGGR